jgi:uncharacterized YccA/Bax inhibitor family protein
VKTSNPVLARLGQAAGKSAGFGPGYGEPYPTAAGYPAAPPAVQPMTMDDVVVKTATLLGITGVSAVIAWNVVPDTALWGFWIGASLVGLVLGLIISFSRMANPVLVVAYAVVEGFFVGLASKVFAFIAGYQGVVLQAVVATFGVFFVMALLYKSRIIRATPRFRKIMISVIAGLFAAMLINFVLSLFHVSTGLRGNGAIGIIFSIVCIVVASRSFILNFDEIEQGIRMGLPQRYSWTAAFGILVGLIWLYLEVLRLLSILQSDD